MGALNFVSCFPIFSIALKQSARGEKYAAGTHSMQESYLTLTHNLLTMIKERVD